MVQKGMQESLAGANGTSRLVHRFFLQLARSWSILTPSRGGCHVIMVLMILLCASPAWAADSPLTVTPQVSHTEALLMGLYFHTPRFGWVVGSGGTILKTVDGGKNWKKVGSGTTESLMSVFFYDEQHGWAVGANGTIRRSQDGMGLMSPAPSARYVDRRDESEVPAC